MLFQRVRTLEAKDDNGNNIIIDDSNYYLIAKSKNKVPLAYADFNEFLVALTFFPDYEFEVPVSDNNHSVFDKERYEAYFKEFPGSISYIILKNDFNNSIVEDFSAMLLPIIAENASLCEQYRNGNEKALNALMGKVLKIDKTISPVKVKEELIKLI